MKTNQNPMGTMGENLEIGGELAPGGMTPPPTNAAKPMKQAKVNGPKAAKGKPVGLKKKPMRSIADLKDAAAKSMANWKKGRQGGSDAGGMGEEGND